MGGDSIFTVGHSRHSPEDFLCLLSSNGVEVLVDVRSRPYSRHVPQFNREPLRVFLESQGVSYRYMGDRLGGMPEDARMYDEDGRVLYSELAKTARFARGIEELRALAKDSKVALMCGEEDPYGCHRFLLVGRVLACEGMEIIHIRGDGRLEKAGAGETPSPGWQMEMFVAEEGEWKSIRSVLPADRRRNSSRL